MNKIGSTNKIYFMSFGVFNELFPDDKKFAKTEVGKEEGGEGYGSKMKVLVLLCFKSLYRMTTDTLSNEKSFKKGPKLLK